MHPATTRILPIMVFAYALGAAACPIINFRETNGTPRPSSDCKVRRAQREARRRRNVRVREGR